jgi:hypothetical protein
VGRPRQVWPRRSTIALIVALSAAQACDHGWDQFTAEQRSICDHLEDVILCDGFEGAEIGDAVSVPPWTSERAVAGGDSAIVDDAAVGSRALHCESPMVAEASAGGYLQAAGILAEDLWIRAWARQDAPGTSPGVVYVRGDDGSGIAMSLDDEHLTLWSERADRTVRTGEPVVEPSRWTCLELHVPIGPAVSLEAYLDGEHVLTLDGADTRSTTAIGTIIVGLGGSYDASACSITVDDVVIAHRRIACP